MRPWANARAFLNVRYPPFERRSKPECGALRSVDFRIDDRIRTGGRAGTPLVAGAPVAAFCPWSVVQRRIFSDVWRNVHKRGGVDEPNFQSAQKFRHVQRHHRVGRVGRRSATGPASAQVAGRKNSRDGPVEPLVRDVAAIAVPARLVQSICAVRSFRVGPGIKKRFVIQDHSGPSYILFVGGTTERMRHRALAGAGALGNFGGLF